MTEIEIMDIFRGQNLTIDDTLKQQLLAEGIKLVQFSLKPTGLTTTFFNHMSKLSPYQEHPISVIALWLLLSGWIFTELYIMYKYIQKLQAKLDSTMFCTTVHNHTTG